MVRPGAPGDDRSVRRLMLLTALATTVLALLAGPAAAATASPQARAVSLLNAARAKAGCAPLKVDARLTRAAQGHSADMVKRRYFAHNSPGGTTPWTRIAKAGYPRNSRLAENIAAGQPTADQVVRTWLRSPAHRANILDCRLRSVGTGLARGGPYGTYWTQDFGSR